MTWKWISLFFIIISSQTALADNNSCAADKSTNHYKVVSILAEPYLMLYNTTSNETSTDNTTATPHEEDPNKNFKGFIKDYLDLLASAACFTYELYQVKDGHYGNKMRGEWDGMIGDVLKGSADIAAAPLIVTTERDQVVDFLYPFQKVEAVLVFARRNPSQEPQIRTLEDVVNQTEFKIETLSNGAIYKDIQGYESELTKQLKDRLLEVEDSLPKTSANGILRARSRENYGFLVESSAVELALRNEPCNLQSIPTGLYKRQYALAVGNQSPLRDTLNDAHVKQSHKLRSLYRKWWGEDVCSTASYTTTSATLAMILLLYLFSKE